MKIIIADDQRVIRELYEAILERAFGSKPTMAENGEELLEKLQGHDFFVSDQNMGSGITGLEAVMQARREKIHIPGILASGLDYSNLMAGVLEAVRTIKPEIKEGTPESFLTYLGISTLRKPFEPSDLRNEIARVSKIRYDSAKNLYIPESSH